MRIYLAFTGSRLYVNRYFDVAKDFIKSCDQSQAGLSAQTNTVQYWFPYRAERENKNTNFIWVRERTQPERMKGESLAINYFIGEVSSNHVLAFVQPSTWGNWRVLFLEKT